MTDTEGLSIVAGWVEEQGLKVIPADQWNRIAAVVRQARAFNNDEHSGYGVLPACDALTADDIEAVRE